MTPVSVLWRDGVHIPGTPLWCDAHRVRSLCFLSHAGRPLRGQHRQLLCTERTFRLLGRTQPGEALITPVGRPFSLGGLRLELFPSGFLPGAASLLVIGAPGGRRVVYASDINPAPRPLAEPTQVRAADVLVCNAPLCAIDRPLPTWDEATFALSSHIDDARNDGAILVVLTPGLGLAQELCTWLDARRVPLLLHRVVRRPLLCMVDLGVCPPPGPTVHPLGPARRPLPGEVVLWPLDRPVEPLLRLVGGTAPLRAVVCAGAAAADGALLRYLGAVPAALGLCAALPFPEGADLPALLRYARDTGAREIYLTAGFGRPAQEALASRRVRVEPLGPPCQLGLFSGPSPVAPLTLPGSAVH